MFIFSNECESKEVQDQSVKSTRPHAVSIYGGMWKDRAGGMAQQVEHLPIKNKALSSNPSTTKNKKKKMEGQTDGEKEQNIMEELSL
jgi:uncharacterized protein YaiL (DUF2058 family)